MPLAVALESLVLGIAFMGARDVGLLLHDVIEEQGTAAPGADRKAYPVGMCHRVRLCRIELTHELWDVLRRNLLLKLYCSGLDEIVCVIIAEDLNCSSLRIPVLARGLDS